jgi:hypothetical protein
VSVHPDELTGTEQAVLLVLMAECRAIPNARLKDFGPELKKPQRDNLLRKNLITVTGKPMVVELDEDGWAMCRAIIGADAPDRTSGQARTIYTLMKSLQRYFDRENLSPSDVFTPPDADADVETRLRGAYASLAERPGAWVGLRRLRDALPDIGRDDVDRELQRLHRDPDVSLIPEENQKTLTDADRAASVRIGNKENHVIAIRP